MRETEKERERAKRGTHRERETERERDRERKRQREREKTALLSGLQPRSTRMKNQVLPILTHLLTHLAL